ncbi:hypothetical protein Btru_010926 [Bulinus truncatus]|nr:hypothetical protein Btru_010926 [Bulinus truncatus]
MDNSEALPRENDGGRNVGDISLNDIRDTFTCVLGLELTHKIVFIGVCACLLTCLTLQTGIHYTSATDVFVYCAVYSAWVTLCLPWLVQNMDGKVGALNTLRVTYRGQHSIVLATRWTPSRGPVKLEGRVSIAASQSENLGPPGKE